MEDFGGPPTAVDVEQARRAAAAALAWVAEVSMAYADARRAQLAQSRRGRRGDGPRGGPSPGEFVADELSLVLREQPYTVQRLLARSRRLASGLGTVWEAFRVGDLDEEQIRVIDRVARRVAHEETLAAIDQQVVAAAQTRSPKQLRIWLLRLVVELEPEAFAIRHRKALAERRVTVHQDVDGMGYVTGELSGQDAADIDAFLAAGARQLGADDPRTEQQRRADLFADLLLGRLRLDDEPVEEAEERGANSAAESTDADSAAGSDEAPDWLEVEEIDPDTGELLGTRRVLVDAAGEPVEPASTAEPPTIRLRPGLRRPRSLRIGVVVPLSSLLGVSNAPGELADRSGLVPAEVPRDLIASADAAGDQVLFTRLLTDDGGRLLNTTELGRFPSARLAEAVRLRAGTCRFPTCTVPADRCDIDHHEPHPIGATAGDNLDPDCRRHHRAKTFAWLASVRDEDGVDWTMPDAGRYRCLDDPFPVGRAA